MKHFVYLVIALTLIVSASASAQFEYIFPSDGSRNNFRETHLILRNGALMDPSSLTTDMIELIGSKSGVIPASVVLSTDGKTVCIEPTIPFAYSENVTVHVKEGLRTLDGETLTGTSFQFSIRREMTQQEKDNLQEYLSTHDDDGNLINDPNQQSTYIPPPAANTRTEHFNFVNIYTNTNPTAGKLYFNRNSGVLANQSTEIGYGIMQPNGDSVFYRGSSTDGANFHKNFDYHYTALRLDAPNHDTGIVVLDDNFSEIEEVHCKNGLTPTQHEHMFYPDGTKWFTCYDWQPGWDLTQYGGGQSVEVNVCWIQEQDANGNVIFQWRSDQHFGILDAATDIQQSITGNTYDPWHLNAMYIDYDGNLIASFRNMDMIVKIRLSGAIGSIVWYWGINWSGNANYIPFITFVNDPDGGFSHPHNVHRISNTGHILLFDNGNLHVPSISQPKEYVLDETNYTATCVWYYTHPAVNGFQMFTKNQGSASRLPNGNTLIGYGLPNIQGLYNGAEIQAGSNNIVWEFRFKDSTEYTYRLYDSTFITVGVPTVEAENNFNVFPNPSDGLVSVDLDLPLADRVDVDVFNIMGQRVYSNSISSTALKNSTLDLSGLDKGFYFLTITSGENKKVSRILLQ